MKNSFNKANIHKIVVRCAKIDTLCAQIGIYTYPYF